ncbi:MAG: L-glutamate gamma-semialdehyde dehydrogenase [Candidatus Eremiobacteraeota bacterium]|nr:L-glutamate gamma-semialdehyde dehydrogenase [Candidatus Eremiobacteraeota bacterium]MBV8532107.1 L-glutamate gamma-semialdehyde dehydrogenase [Candidatus Eremiobacteraeota bacterium]
MTTTVAKPANEVAPFQNEAVKDFRDQADAAAMRAALASVRNELAKHYPLVIDGRKVETEKKIRSVNPANPDELVGLTSSASKEQAAAAIEAAARAFDSWRHRSLPERAAYIFKAAELLRRRRFEYDALLVYEVGKSWVEADGDICESIDFLEFYAREALRYAQPQPLVPLAGEENELIYIPLGVGAVIPPWNFAGAIMIGMTAAAIVCGNTVVLKPSSDAAVIAAWFVDLLHEIGVPPGVVNFIPGSGSEIGDLIVSHPKIRFISFTGSKEVGLRINELAAKPQSGQKWIKRVVAEMGGKDSIVVAADADVDAAVEGVALSAFGFQGQKCSACSRAIVEERVYDEFVDKLRQRVSAISVGDPSDPANFMGPVVNEAALKSIVRYIERGQSEGRLLTGGKRAGDRGYFIEPTVIADVAPDATIAQEEIFGPVLAIIKAKDFEDALAIANNTEFGLTGSLYTSDEKKIERAREDFFVGNLYFNRKSTGAMVGVHPFGGFNMSGTDSKAGGRDYLLLFMQAKSMSRKV